MRFQRQCSAIAPDTRLQIIRLFSALEYGEQLAHHCASEQAYLVHDIQLSRFLGLQSRQEAFHAKFFHNAIQYLDNVKSCAVPGSLYFFGHKLKGALQRKDLTETLIGQQIVLEAFGGAVLYHLNRGLDNHGIGLGKLRRRLLQQEQSHTDFGNELLRRQLITGNATIEKIQCLSSEYLTLVHTVINEMSDVFTCLDEDPDEYKKYLYTNLPHWLKFSST